MSKAASKYGFETQIYYYMLKSTYSKWSAQASEMKEKVLYS